MKWLVWQQSEMGYEPVILSEAKNLGIYLTLKTQGFFASLRMTW